MADEPPPQMRPRVAQRGPYSVELKAGEVYFWCYCGWSENQPFCDTSHQKTDLTPHPFTVEETKVYALCGCKQTSGAPFCDDTHETLPE